jgi:hypothetical protein
MVVTNVILSKRKQLVERVNRLSKMIDVELRVDYNAAGYRIERADGTRQLSPRLAMFTINVWVDAAIEVATALGR